MAASQPQQRSDDGARTGPSTNPSKVSMFVSAEDRSKWDSKLDSVDIPDLSSIIYVGNDGETVLTTANVVTVVAPLSITYTVGGVQTVAMGEFDTTVTSSTFNVKTNGLTDPAALAVTTTTVETNLPFTANDGIEVPSDTDTKVSGTITTPFATVTGFGIESLSLTITGLKSSVIDATSLLSSPANVIDSIDIGKSPVDGQLLTFGFLPKAALDLTGTSSVEFKMGYSLEDGAPSYSTTSTTNRGVVTNTGTTVSVRICGIIRFMYAAGFANTTGAWVMM